MNRFLKGAMTERLSSWSPTDPKARGIPSKELINVYRRWGEGGFGVIVTGNVMTQYEHLEAAGNPIIPAEAPYEGERFEAFRDLATASKAEGALIIAQVSHPGRQVAELIQKNPISASDVQLQTNLMGLTFAKPRPATEQDIKDVIEGFAHAAEYLEKAGFDGINIHGAHGYLLAQFLSPTTNKRTDKYGGSLENRARLILEIAQEIQRRVKPSFIISIKINSVEFQEGGFQAEEARKLVSLLEENRFDFVELSGGTYEKLVMHGERESTKKREAFFLEFAEKITPALTMTRSYVTGGLKTVGAMVSALETCDGVGIARPVCQEFRLCKDILEGRLTGALIQKTDLTDFGLTSMVAGTQIRQVGRDQKPIDMSDEANVVAFMTDLQAYMMKMQNNQDGKEYGFIDLTTKAVPYGAVEA